MNASPSHPIALKRLRLLTLAGALLILLSTVLWIAVGSTKDTDDSLADVKALCTVPQMWAYGSEYAPIEGESLVSVKSEVVDGLLTLSSAYSVDGVSYRFVYEPESGRMVASYREDMVGDATREYLAVYNYSDKARSEARTLFSFAPSDGREPTEDTLHAAAEEFASAACALLAANTAGGLSVLWLLLLLLGMLLFSGCGVSTLILKKAPAVDESRNVWGDRIR
jgi:hypothetical protein